MGDDSLEPFEVSSMPAPDQEPSSASQPEMRSSNVAERKYLCVTIVDHNAVLEGADDESFINLRIPAALADSGLRMVPEGKLGRVDPQLIVEMVEDGATGELVNITERNKSIMIRIE
jgi:hypothetical protein